MLAPLPPDQAEEPSVSHETNLIATLSVALGLAFAGGFVATRLRLSPIIGYLLAGFIVGPFTPGFVADGELAPQLAEIGVILLMLGVGIHFSFRDLLSMRKIAVPGAILQCSAATALAILITRFWGWSLEAGLVLGLAISIASTVVLLRSLLDHDLLDYAGAFLEQAAQKMRFARARVALHQQARRQQFLYVDGDRGAVGVDADFNRSAHAPGNRSTGGFGPRVLRRLFQRFGVGRL